MSREALLILLQGGLLVSRTVLTDRIAAIEGLSGSTLVSQVSTDRNVCMLLLYICCCCCCLLLLYISQQVLLHQTQALA